MKSNLKKETRLYKGIKASERAEERIRVRPPKPAEQGCIILYEVLGKYIFYKALPINQLVSVIKQIP